MIISNFPSGGGSPELVTDGLILHIDPENDAYSLDDSGYITNYQISGFERDGITEAKLGINDLWETNNGYTSIDDDSVYFYAASTGRQFRLTKDSFSGDKTVVAEFKFTASTSALAAIVIDTPTLTTANSGYASIVENEVLSLRKYVSGAGTVLASMAMDLTADTWYKMKLYRSGTSLKCKVWLSSSSEPAGWNLETTDATHSSGKVGTYSYYSSVRVDYKNFVLEANLKAISGNGKIIYEAGVLNGKKRIQCPLGEDDFIIEYLYPFIIPEKVERTVIMVYKILGENTRNNMFFFNKYSTYGFGVMGKTGFLEVDGPLIWTNVYGGYNLSEKIRVDRYGLSICASTNDYAVYGADFGNVQLPTGNTMAWTPPNNTQIKVSGGHELVELLYYDRELTFAEMSQMNLYMINKYDLLSQEIVDI